jgi:hypothetical protein
MLIKELHQRTNAYEEFSGTLLGFDDYVSEYPCMRSGDLTRLILI